MVFVLLVRLIDFRFTLILARTGEKKTLIDRKKREKKKKKTLVAYWNKYLDVPDSRFRFDAILGCCCCCCDCCCNITKVTGRISMQWVGWISSNYSLRVWFPRENYFKWRDSGLYLLSVESLLLCWLIKWFDFHQNGDSNSREYTNYYSNFSFVVHV